MTKGVRAIQRAPQLVVQNPQGDDQPWCARRSQTASTIPARGRGLSGARRVRPCWSQRLCSTLDRVWALLWPCMVRTSEPLPPAAAQGEEVYDAACRTGVCGTGV
jgi:hypothetical protein